MQIGVETEGMLRAPIQLFTLPSESRGRAVGSGGRKHVERVSDRMIVVSAVGAWLRCGLTVRICARSSLSRACKRVLSEIVSLCFVSRDVR